MTRPRTPKVPIWGIGSMFQDREHRKSQFQESEYTTRPRTPEVPISRIGAFFRAENTGSSNLRNWRIFQDREDGKSQFQSCGDFQHPLKNQTTTTEYNEISRGNQQLPVADTFNGNHVFRKNWNWAKSTLNHRTPWNNTRHKNRMKIKSILNYTRTCVPWWTIHDTNRTPWQQRFAETVTRRWNWRGPELTCCLNKRFLPYTQRKFICAKFLLAWSNILRVYSLEPFTCMCMRVWRPAHWRV